VYEIKMYVADVRNDNHEFCKINKKKLSPLFKSAVRQIRKSASPDRLKISEIVRIMLIVSRKNPSKKDREFMEELLYFIKVAEDEK
jgi:hypothetical protein